jgi:hypothetical protein
MAVWWIPFFSTQKNHLQLLNIAGVEMHLETKVCSRPFPIWHLLSLSRSWVLSSTLGSSPSGDPRIPIVENSLGERRVRGGWGRC